MSGRRFLTLDQSPSFTGFTLWDEGEDRARLWGAKLCDGIHNRRLAFIAIHREIAAVHKERPITAMAYEQPIKRPSDKVEKLIALYGVAAHIESIAEVKGIPSPARIDARSWRSTYLGKEAHGAGTERLKAWAVQRCEQYGYEPETHDVAESHGIMDHFLLSMKITPPWRIAVPFLAPLA